MKKSTMLKIVNPILFLLFVVHFFLIILHKFVNFDSFYTVHGFIGYAIGVVILIHVFLNWSWIKAQLSAGKNKKAAN